MCRQDRNAVTQNATVPQYGVSRKVLFFNAMNFFLVALVNRELFCHVEQLPRIVCDSSSDNLPDDAVEIYSVIKAVVKDSQSRRIVRHEMNGLRCKEEFDEADNILNCPVRSVQHSPKFQINPVNTVAVAAPVLSENLSNSVKFRTARVVNIKLPAHVTDVLVELFKLRVIVFGKFKRVPGTEPLRKMLRLIE